MEIDSEYVLLQHKYRILNKNNQHIFPPEWYYVKEYKLKKKILNECISKNILIVDSSNYFLFKKIALSQKG